MNWIAQTCRLQGKIFRRSVFFLALSLFLSATNLFGALQFDVFVGYDGLVPQAAWVPITCELKNDGPTFTAIVEVSPGQFAGGQPRRMIVELPTGSLKRVTIPVFSSAQYMMRWDVRLLNAKGKVLAEQLNIKPRKMTSNETRIVGSLARTAS